MLTLTYAHHSEIGQRSRNEDALRIARNGNLCHAIVSDGAGGHYGGDEASRRVVETLDAALANQATQGGRPDRAHLSQAIRFCHEMLDRQQSGRPSAQRMHATVVALWLDLERRQAVWSHVGDSRMYRLRRGHLDLVTEDDSVVQQLVRAGYLTAAQAGQHPQKNQLVAALGMTDPVEPNTHASDLQEGDAYLLCTDGWWESLDATTLEHSLTASPNAGDWLLHMLVHIRNHAPARQDNHTAVAIWAGDPNDVTCLSSPVRP